MENMQVDLSSVTEILKLLRKSEQLARDTYEKVLKAKQAIEDAEPQSSNSWNDDKSQKSAKYLQNSPTFDSVPPYTSTIEAAILDGVPQKSKLEQLDYSKHLYETILHYCTSLKQGPAFSSHLEKKLAGTSMGKCYPRPAIDLALDKVKNYMDLVSFQCECYFHACPPSGLSAKDRRHCQSFHSGVLTRKAQMRDKTKETERRSIDRTVRADEDTNTGKVVLEKSTPAQVEKQCPQECTPQAAPVTSVKTKVPSTSGKVREVTRYMSQEFIQETSSVRSSGNRKGPDVGADAFFPSASDSVEFQRLSDDESGQNSPKSSESEKDIDFEEKKKDNSKKPIGLPLRVHPSASTVCLPIVNMAGLSRLTTVVSCHPDDIDEEGSDIMCESPTRDYSDNAARLKCRARRPRPGVGDTNQSRTDYCGGTWMKKNKNVEYPVRKSSSRLAAPVLEKWTRLQVKTCVVKSKASQTEPQW